VAEQVYLATDTGKVMAEMGLTPPSTSYKSFAVMSKSFDPDKAEDYLASFKIRKAS
jgi:nitrate/nitrite transport system substrate-binding protein